MGINIHAPHSRFRPVHRPDLMNTILAAGALASIGLMVMGGVKKILHSPDESEAALSTPALETNPSLGEGMTKWRGEINCTEKDGTEECQQGQFTFHPNPLKNPPIDKDGDGKIDGPVNQENGTLCLRYTAPVPKGTTVGFNDQNTTIDRICKCWGPTSSTVDVQSKRPGCVVSENFTQEAVDLQNGGQIAQRWLAEGSSR